MGLLAFFQNHFWTILFYGVIISLLYFNRKKFEFQGIVAIYRTKIGIKTMDVWAKKFGPVIRGLAYLGIVVCYVIMAGATLAIAVLVFLMFYGVRSFTELVQKTPQVGPAFPGVCIDGVFCLPLVTGFISIFLIIVMHEFAHGVVARAHKIPVKNTGYVQLAVIPGAFVEPDEKKLLKAKKRVQLAIFGAGAFTNFIAAGIAIMLFIGFVGASHTFVEGNFQSTGFYFTQVANNSPAQAAHLPVNMTFNIVNSKEVSSVDELSAVLQNMPPGTSVNFSNDGSTGDPKVEYSLITAAHPQNASRSFIGVYDLRTKFTPKNPSWPSWSTPVIFAALGKITEFLVLFFALSISVGGINLLPLGPLDGGRMYLLGMQHIFGEHGGKKVHYYTSLFIAALFGVLIVQFLLYVVFKAL